MLLEYSSRTLRNLRLIKSNRKIITSTIYDSIHLYTDGSQRHEKSGWGMVGFFPNLKMHRLEMYGGIDGGTINSAELKAVIESVKLLFFLPSHSYNTIIYTDSQYVERGVNQWLGEWKQRGWKTSKNKKLKNVEMWKNLYSLLRLYPKNKIEIRWVKSHSGIKGNEIADKLAKKGRDL